MLVLIPGITGHVGQHLARYALSKGLSVRGLGRTPSKLDPAIAEELESFVTSENYYDVPALDKAVAGVDAIIVAYLGTPELQVDGQLLLLRAAERAGVRNFHAGSWCYDFRKTPLGEHESYDPFTAFARVAEISSPIKPMFLFTGVLTEVMFGVEGRADFGIETGGVFDKSGGRFEYYGTGHEKYQWTTEEDAAKFSIELVMSEAGRSGNGGYFSAWSGEHSVLEMAEIWEIAKGKKPVVKNVGTIKNLEERAIRTRAESTPAGFWGYIGSFYQLFTINGRWLMKGENLFPEVKRTALEDMLKNSH